MDNKEIIRKRMKDLLAKGATMVAPGEKITNGRPTGRQAIIIGVQEKVSLKELRTVDIIPKTLDGVETDVIVFHKVDILPPKVMAANVRTSRNRPLFGGISCGNGELVTAGTILGRVWKGGLAYACTNWHVGGMNEGKIGDLMWQPGHYDGGTAADATKPIVFKPEVILGGGPIPSDCPIGGAVAMIPNLLARMMRSRTRLVPIRPQAEGENLVDLCLFGPFDESELTDEIYEIGHVDTRNWRDFAVGDIGEKSGRTSAVNSFDTQFIHALVNVGLGGTQFAIFSDVDIFGPGAEGGDSGSGILHPDNYIGSLLFAGSDLNTIGCAWRNVRKVGGLD